MKGLRNLAAFASDMGGAYQLYYFIKDNPILKKYKKYFFFSGDSEFLIEKKDNDKNLNDLDFNLILCSTSGNDYEKKIIKLANKKKKKVWVIFDNWTNYVERLVYRGEVLQTEKIIVTDLHAKKLAKKIYKNHDVELVPNYFLEHLRKLKKKKNILKKKKIIFYTSPENYFYKKKSNQGSRKDWESNEKRNLIKEVKYILNSHLYKDRSNNSFVIRLHPQLNYLRNEKDFIFSNLVERENENLEKSIIDTDISVGKDSYALFLTKSLRIPTFSIVKGLYKRKFNFPYSMKYL